MEGRDGRTERATPKRREEEHRKGNFCVSPEVTSMAVLLLGVVSLRFAIPPLFDRIGDLMSRLLSGWGPQNWDAAMARDAYLSGGGMFLVAMLPIFVPVMIGSVLGNMVQTGPHLSAKALEWKLSGLNPMQGLKKMFSAEALAKMVLSLVKVALVVLVFYLFTRRRVLDIGSLPLLSAGAIIRWILLFIYRLTLAVAVLFVAVAVLDWCFRKRRYEKSIMMTKHEVREEARQHEPSPVIRGARRKKWRELTMLRMMAAVPKASVVITNPTHVAVALRYDPQSMASPRVVAKGVRLVAQRIKEVARQHGVSIVERPELARALNEHVAIGQEIPSRFYAAVAAVLAYLHRLKHGGPARAPAGAAATHRAPSNPPRAAAPGGS